MNLLSINKLTKTIGDRTLFDSISFGINEGEKIGIIGINGTGKSTLLRLITGKEEADSGEIAKNRICKIAFLEQNPSFDPESTILEHIFSSNSPIIQLIKEYESTCEQMENSLEDLSEKMEKLYSEMDRLNAWEFERNFKSLLNEMGVKNLNSKMKELSGGMFKKVNLIHTLIEDSNFLILDEPTNHLDIDSILWLENYLLETDKAVLLVTHDRYFLNEIANTIYEIDNKKIFSYPGNYDYFLEKKAEREEFEQRVEHKIQSFMKSELEWLRKQPRARGTKQKARIKSYEQLSAREKPVKLADIELSTSGRRLGKKILEVSNIQKAYSTKKVINGFSYTFKKNERIGIVGPNGAGKSTLLDIISQRQKQDSGHVDIGMNTSIGYFDQKTIKLDPEMRVIDFFKKNVGETVIINENEKVSISTFLENFLFNSTLQYNPIKKLSGGEVRRLYLVFELSKSPNFLILDEPTNDLDIKTLSILEDFLSNFPGCLLIVSHDRYFMDRLVDSLLILDGNGNIKGFPGNYTEYLIYKEKEKEKKKEETTQATEKIETNKSPSNKDPNKLSYKEQKKLEKLEEAISKLETEKNNLEKEMQGSPSYPRLAEITKRLSEIENELLENLSEWEATYR